jgi:2-phosphosulfolactate phosphatase
MKSSAAGFDKPEFDSWCEWGEAGLSALLPVSDVVVIVDVLSFCTCVDVAVGRSVEILPYRWRDDSAREFARLHGAELASARGEGFSLSPRSYANAAPGTRVVLPSPNGASLTLAAAGRPVFAGCLRNASAVAAAARQTGRRIAVIPAGEWWPDGSFRPCLEDLLGAGAILEKLPGAASPEARTAVAAFLSMRHDLRSALRGSVSGRELIERGFEDDVLIAAELDVSKNAPVFREPTYTAAAP